MHGYRFLNTHRNKTDVLEYRYRWEAETLGTYLAKRNQ